MENSVVPQWFVDSINEPSTSQKINVEGSEINYRRWGAPGKQGLVFVHGNGAHSHWWDFLAPFFIDRFSVVALDLSGMGNSDRREGYSAVNFAKEVMAVAAVAGSVGKPVLIGHSMGGKVAMKAGNMYPGAMAGIIMLDSPCIPVASLPPKNAKSSFSNTNKVYASYQEIRAKFRLIPSQPCENGFILDYIAEKSVKKVNDKWSWKFDALVNSTLDFQQLMIELPSAECPVIGSIYGEKSKLFPQEIIDYNLQIFANRAPVVAIPDAAHHLLLDEPLLLTSELKKLLAN